MFQELNKLYNKHLTQITDFASDPNKRERLKEHVAGLDEIEQKMALNFWDKMRDDPDDISTEEFKDYVYILIKAGVKNLYPEVDNQVLRELTNEIITGDLSDMMEAMIPGILESFRKEW